MSTPAPAWRRAGLTVTVTATILAVVAAIVVFVSGPAFAADRDPIFFQQVTDNAGTFVAVGTGPFATTYPKGVVDDGKTLGRNKVTAPNFTKTYTWGSDGTTGGMVIKNISGKAICQITIGILDTSTFPNAVKVYQAPSGWQVTVSKDQKTLTFAAVKNPDDCVPDGGWFWMKVPASPTPNEPGGATLNGKLALADAGSDADALAYIEPDSTATGTGAAATSTSTATDSPTSTSTATATATATDSPTSTSTATATDSPTSTASAIPTGSAPPSPGLS